LISFSARKGERDHKEGRGRLDILHHLFSVHTGKGERQGKRENVNSRVLWKKEGKLEKEGRGEVLPSLIRRERGGRERKGRKKSKGLSFVLFFARR